MDKNAARWIIWVITLVLILAGVSIIALLVGTMRIPLPVAVNCLFTGERLTSCGSVLFNIRLPRVILGFAVGGALSLAGVILQGMFRNPLVEPYTLGISGGAALGVCLNIAFGINRHIGVISMPISGFLGSMLIILIVYFLSARKGILKMNGLLLSGVMISFVCSSLFMLIMAVMRIEDLHGIIFWTMGALEQPNWILIRIMLIISLSGLIYSYFYCKELNAFSLGTEQAAHLVVDVEKTKRNLFILTSVLTGCSVSVAGIIGFVGLVIPHFIRLFAGSDHRFVLILSYLAGGIFLIASDTLARVIISPLELPVGVITGIAGGTIFIYALTKKEGGSVNAGS